MHAHVSIRVRCLLCVAAKAGVHFVACEGELRFGPGETWQSIEVTLAPSPVWTPALEFNIHLHSARGGSIGLSLHFCKVWVLHDGNFPAPHITPASSRLELLVESFRYLATNEIVRSGSIKILLIDQLP